MQFTDKELSLTVPFQKIECNIKHKTDQLVGLLKFWCFYPLKVRKAQLQKKEQNSLRSC